MESLANSRWSCVNQIMRTWSWGLKLTPRMLTPAVVVKIAATIRTVPAKSAGVGGGENVSVRCINEEIFCIEKEVMQSF